MNINNDQASIESAVASAAVQLSPRTVTKDALIAVTIPRRIDSSRESMRREVHLSSRIVSCLGLLVFHPSPASSALATGGGSRSGPGCSGRAVQVSHGATLCGDPWIDVTGPRNRTQGRAHMRGRCQVASHALGTGLLVGTLPSGPAMMNALRK
jgi:hypothetical protein